MKKWLLSRFFVLLLVVGITPLAFADDVADEIAQLKVRIAALEQKIEKQPANTGDRETLDQIRSALNGISMHGGITGIVQGVSDANGDSQLGKDEDVTDASYSVDLEFAKEFEKGQALIHLETGDGAGVDEELKLFSAVNRDADNSDNTVSVTEAWYEHRLINDKLKLAFGKLDPTSAVDDNAYANDEASQFLGSMFRNSPVIEFPDNGAGLRTSYSMNDNAEASFIAVDGNSDWEDVADGLFVAGQFNIKPKFFGRDGNYRLLGWTNGQNHTRWDNTEKNKENSFGYGISFDQELTDIVGVFARYGWQNPKVVLSSADDFDITTAAGLEQSYSLGVQFKGAAWGRADDVTALAYGQIFPSEKYKDYDSTRKADPENHLEWYYNWRVTDYFHVSPDVQVIWNPYGGDATNGDDTILVGGMRAQIDF